MASNLTKTEMLGVSHEPEGGTGCEDQALYPERLKAQRESSMRSEPEGGTGAAVSELAEPRGETVASESKGAKRAEAETEWPSSTQPSFLERRSCKSELITETCAASGRSPSNASGTNARKSMAEHRAAFLANGLLQSKIEPVKYRQVLAMSNDAKLRAKGAELEAKERLRCRPIEVPDDPCKLAASLQNHTTRWPARKFSKKKKQASKHKDRTAAGVITGEVSVVNLEEKTQTENQIASLLPADVGNQSVNSDRCNEVGSYDELPIENEVVSIADAASKETEVQLGLSSSQEKTDGEVAQSSSAVCERALSNDSAANIKKMSEHRASFLANELVTSPIRPAVYRHVLQMSDDTMLRGQGDHLDESEKLQRTPIKVPEDPCDLAASLRNHAASWPARKFSKKKRAVSEKVGVVTAFSEADEAEVEKEEVSRSEQDVDQQQCESGDKTIKFVTSDEVPCENKKEPIVEDVSKQTNVEPGTSGSQGETDGEVVPSPSVVSEQRPANGSGKNVPKTMAEHRMSLLNTLLRSKIGPVRYRHVLLMADNTKLREKGAELEAKERLRLASIKPEDTMAWAASLRKHLSNKSKAKERRRKILMLVTALAKRIKSDDGVLENVNLFPSKVGYKVVNKASITILIKINETQPMMNEVPKPADVVHVTTGSDIETDSVCEAENELPEKKSPSKWKRFKKSFSCCLPMSCKHGFKKRENIDNGCQNVGREAKLDPTASELEADSVLKVDNGLEPPTKSSPKWKKMKKLLTGKRGSKKGAKLEDGLQHEGEKLPVAEKQQVVFCRYRYLLGRN